MTRRSNAIKDAFVAYSRFVKEPKALEHKKIKATKPPAVVAGVKRNNVLGASGINYEGVHGRKWFGVEISLEDRHKYHLRIYADVFGDGPCFRFDSKGRAHSNPETGTGLRNRQVRTPHFHKFNEEGVEIAFQTATLREESESSRIVSDYKFGLEHFCQEARLTCNDGTHPLLELEAGEFDLSSGDPLNGVPFK